MYCKKLLGVFLGFIALQATPALAQNCGRDFQHAYEKGVEDGRVDGAQLIDPNPLRHGIKFVFKGKDTANCYREGYDIGYANASADARKRPARPTHQDAPTPGSNERAYYDDGCEAGTRDAHMSMSMFYGRHSDRYDTRFEPYFKQGYEACWKMFR